MNNFPKVVTQLCLKQELNPRPVDLKSSALPVAPPVIQLYRSNISVCNIQKDRRCMGRREFFRCFETVGRTSGPYEICDTYPKGAVSQQEQVEAVPFDPDSAAKRLLINRQGDKCVVWLSGLSRVFLISM